MRFTAIVFLGLALLLCGNAAWAQEWQQLEELQRRCDDPTLQSAIALPQPKLIVETGDGKTTLKARIGMEMRKKFVLSLDVASPTNPSGETTLAGQDGLSKGTTVDGAFSWFQQPKQLKNSTMIPILSVKTHIEQQGFDFFLPSAGPPAGLKETSESHMNHKLTGSLGGYFSGSSVYASLNYARGTEFKAGATKDFCAPAGLAGVLQCESLMIAPPRKTQTELLELESRGWVGNLGVGVHLTRDLRGDITTVELPVYFLQNLGTSEMELNLGARAKWQSDTRAYSLSVFIGPAFSTVFRPF